MLPNSSSSSIARTRLLWLCLASAAALFYAIDARPDYTGLDGPYCQRYYRSMQCCTGRQDECSVPILGTLCYCDDFCANRTQEEDCCPDFWSFCKGEYEPDATTTAAPDPYHRGVCEHNGRKFYHGSTFKKNCNVCKCSSLHHHADILCEENRCLIEDELIERINDENLGWTAGSYPEFWGHTLDEGMKLRLGTMNPSKSMYRMHPVRRTYERDDLPREFDSRTKWPHHITPVRDQGWCAASWAISTADVAADRFAIMSRGAERLQLSAQNLLSCNIKGQQGCDGGYLDKAWLYMRKFGIVDEHCYPWLGRYEKCAVERRGKLSDSGCRPRNSYALRNEMFRVGPAYRLSNETDIMYEIMISGPVQATMRVYQDFFNYKYGIYTHSRIAEHFPSGYHSVRIVGWGEEPSPIDGRPIQFWRVANSWGCQWGEDGYFRIVKGTNECEIESFALGVWAKTV